MKQKIKNLYNKNQFVIETTEKTATGKEELKKALFQSYESMIAEIEILKDNSKVINLSKRWDYSKTTLKHLYLFIEKYFYSLYLELLQVNNKKEYIKKLIKEEKIKNTLEY